MEKIRVILADDYIPYRWSVLQELSNNPSIEIVEEASDGEEAVRKTLEHSPDVVLLDLHMPKGDGHEVTRQILSKMPHIKIIINTISDNESDLEEALKAGARGYLIKEGDPDQIADAISYVHHGGILISPTMVAKVGADFVAATVLDDPGTKEENEVRIWETISDDDVRDTTIIADITLSPPVETAEMLKLFGWLSGELNGTVEKVMPSLTSDTSLRVIFPEPILLCSKIADAPTSRDITIERVLRNGKKVEREPARSVGLRLTLAV